MLFILAFTWFLLPAVPVGLYAATFAIGVGPWPPYFVHVFEFFASSSSSCYFLLLLLLFLLLFSSCWLPGYRKSEQLWQHCR